MGHEEGDRYAVPVSPAGDRSEARRSGLARDRAAADGSDGEIERLSFHYDYLKFTDSTVRSVTVREPRCCRRSDQAQGPRAAQDQRPVERGGLERLHRSGQVVQDVLPRRERRAHRRAGARVQQRRSAATVGAHHGLPEAEAVVLECGCHGWTGTSKVTVTDQFGARVTYSRRSHVRSERGAVGVRSDRTYLQGAVGHWPRWKAHQVRRNAGRRSRPTADRSVRPTAGCSCAWCRPQDRSREHYSASASR